MTTWIDLGAADEFCEDTPVAKQAGGQPLAVFRLGDDVYALRDKCSHGNARLSDGYVEDGCVECPLHQGLIDIRSGAARSAPITTAVRSFPVRVVAGRVEVDVAEPAGADAGAACSSATEFAGAGASTGAAAAAVGAPAAAGGCGGAYSGAAPAASPAAPAALLPESRTFSVRIASIEKAGADVAILRLHQDSGAPLDYLPGQYLDVLLDGGVRRSYSMASMGGGDTLELHIRHLPGGHFTDHVFGALQAGERLALEGPAGDFYLRSGEAPVILLASGTGFAPVKAIMQQAIAQGNSRKVKLYWGGRKAADLYQHTLCLQWAAELSWFEYIPVISEPAESDWQGRTGFVHQAVLDDHADLALHQVYACGAPPMVAAARTSFSLERSLPATQFFADAFLSLADLPAKR
ncbi:UNVERIFIED_ORG: CDP-4-dehydro-6-deoxyglucose reductase [Zoogloea ramigera]|uniref:Anthranilate 1,2-dioxygenase ferredoxin subunit AndAb n=1 Tax=Duganella zoogloeoides TaxID=75659 RepID=A0ABZ0XXP9_9BURK|nr:anthranilate 1,2-dioxygenase ferredoxin subunit AndAb [Duganella zoogloeoides]WQH04543.1 anthranilate 1,2-dioxygenase ferredoxin subunit AndAb [Duganella zoogloeoides]